MFRGAFTALITPFRDGQVDYNRLVRNVEDQIAAGIDGLVPVGTTGESPTLSHEEHRKVIETVVQAAKGRVKVIAGAGSNATSEAVALTRHAKAVGADGALSVNPYYNKPTQEGLYRHFMTIADAADLPVLLYNIPGRTGVALTPATIARLAKHPNIVGDKEATGDLNIATEVAALCGEDFIILSGDDSLTLPIISVGGHGVISVLSNLIPADIKALVTAALTGDYAEARKHHLRLYPLFRGMFVETNPIPIKAAMQMLGLDTGELRLPMTDLSEPHREPLRKLLTDHNLL